MKRIIILLLLVLGISSCDKANNKVNQKSIYDLYIIELLKNDSTIVTKEYPIYRYENYDYIIVDNKIIGRYYVNYNTDNLLVMIFMVILSLLIIIGIITNE